MDRTPVFELLSEEQCAAWAAGHGHAVPAARGRLRVPALAGEEEFLELVWPEDSGKRIALARAVLQHSLPHGPVLIWITEWGVWPSSEHMPLFTRFREAHGESRPLIEAPGHLVHAAAFDDGLSVLAMALLFFWDVYVLPTGNVPAFFSSHDEYAGLFVQPEQDLDAILNAFSGWIRDDTGQSAPS